MEGAEHRFLVRVRSHSLKAVANNSAQRKLIGPAFTAQAVKGMSPIFLQKAEELRDRWDDLISANDSISCGSATFDVAHWISRTAFDIFGLAGFDYHFNALHDESEEGIAPFLVSDSLPNYG